MLSSNSWTFFEIVTFSSNSWTFSILTSSFPNSWTISKILEIKFMKILNSCRKYISQLFFKPVQYLVTLQLLKSLQYETKQYVKLYPRYSTALFFWDTVLRKWAGAVGMLCAPEGGGKGATSGALCLGRPMSVERAFFRSIHVVYIWYPSKKNVVYIWS